MREKKIEVKTAMRTCDNCGAHTKCGHFVRDNREKWICGLCIMAVIGRHPDM